MKIKKKLIGLSKHSAGVVVDKVVRNALGLKKGDELWVTLEKCKKKRR